MRLFGNSASVNGRKGSRHMHRPTWLCLACVVSAAVVILGGATTASASAQRPATIDRFNVANAHSPQVERMLAADRARPPGIRPGDCPVGARGGRVGGSGHRRLVLPARIRGQHRLDPGGRRGLQVRLHQGDRGLLLPKPLLRDGRGRREGGRADRRAYSLRHPELLRRRLPGRLRARSLRSAG